MRALTRARREPQARHHVDRRRSRRRARRRRTRRWMRRGTALRRRGAWRAPAKTSMSSMSPERDVLCDAAAARRRKRLLSLSSLAAREPTLSMYSSSKRRGEAVLQDASVPWTVFRPPAVYGPGRQGTATVVSPDDAGHRGGAGSCGTHVVDLRHRPRAGDGRVARRADLRTDAASNSTMERPTATTGPR